MDCSYVIAFSRQNDWTSKRHYKALDITANQCIIPSVGIFKEFDCKVMFYRQPGIKEKLPGAIYAADMAQRVLKVMPFMNFHRPLSDIVHFYRLLALFRIVNSAIS